MEVNRLPEEREQQQRRRTLGIILIISLALHGLAAIGAGLWIVARAWHKPVTVFVAQKTVALPPHLDDQQQAGQAFAAATASSTSQDQAVSRNAAPIEVPALPPFPSDASVVVDPTSSAFSGEGSAANAGIGAGLGLSGKGGGFSFFNVEGDGRRIVIALDVSDSMFIRQPGVFEKIAQETYRALDGLGGDQLFDLLVFADGSLAWKPELALPTDANRSAARQWLESIVARGRNFTVRSGKGTVLFEGGGSRGDTMLKQAFGLQPDRILILTDGQWDEAPLATPPRTIGAAELNELTDTLQKSFAAQNPGAAPVRIDVFFLSTKRTQPGEEDSARQIAQRNGGQFVTLRSEDLMR